MAISGALQASPAVDSGWALWDCGKVFGGLGFAVVVGSVGASSIIGFAAGVLCQVLRSFFWFGMSRLGEILQVQGLDNFGD
jgi:hypothetical protein